MVLRPCLYTTRVDMVATSLDSHMSTGYTELAQASQSNVTIALTTLFQALNAHIWLYLIVTCHAHE